MRTIKQGLCVLTLCGTCVNAHEWALMYTGESAHNLRGGVKTGDAYLGNLDLTVQWLGLDVFAPEASVFAYVLGNHGESPSELIGDVQVFSNIDAPETLKLYEFWFEQPFAAGAASLKMGLMDLNGEFDVIDSAGLFQNSSFGIGPDFSQSGVNGPSIFPSTSFGVRWATAIRANSFAQCIVLDGVPGDPDNEKGTHIQFNSGDGVLMTCEAGYRANAQTMPNGVSKWALGSWRYSAMSTTIDGQHKDNNDGVYLLAEHSVWRHSDRRVDVFARFGRANDRVNAFARYVGTGVVLNGVVAEDYSDQIGLAIASVQASDQFREAESTAERQLRQRETTFELAYRYSVNDWLTLQASLQRIHNPGLDPSLNDATAIALRFELGRHGEF